MLHHNTLIHNYCYPRFTRCLRSLLVNNAHLHPNNRGFSISKFQIDSLLHNRRYIRRSPKNIHNINRLLNFQRYFQQIFVTLFAQNFIHSGIYWDNSVTMSLHVLGYFMAGFISVDGKSNNRYYLAFFEDFLDFCLAQIYHPELRRSQRMITKLLSSLIKIFKEEGN